MRRERVHLANERPRWAPRYRALYGSDESTSQASPSSDQPPRARSGWTPLFAALAATFVAAGLTAFGVQSILPTAVNGRPPAQSGGPPHPSAAPSPIQVTLKEAQRRAGFRLLTLSSYQPANLQKVLYRPGQAGHPQVPGANQASVELDYVVNGVPLRITESKGNVNPALAASQAQGLAMQPETVNGSTYLVLRSADGSRLLLITSTTTRTPNLVVSINAMPNGIDPQTASQLIRHVS